jgi:hypothetical protein
MDIYDWSLFYIPKILPHFGGVVLEVTSTKISLSLSNIDMYRHGKCANHFMGWWYKKQRPATFGEI